MASEIESLRMAVSQLPRTGTSAYRIPGCEPEDDDRYTEPSGLADIKGMLTAADVAFWDASEYSKAIKFELDGRTINIFCVSRDSLAAMAATTALLTRLAEFPEFVAMLQVKRLRYEVFRVIYALLEGRD